MFSGYSDIIAQLGGIVKQKKPFKNNNLALG